MDITLNNLNMLGISCAIPKNEVPVSNFYEKFGEKEVKRIVLSTGIKNFRIAPPNINTFDLCVAAAKTLFQNLSINVNEIGAVVFVSQTPTYRMPATSCLLQDRLGLSKTALAFDINYGCSGYIYGLYQAALLVASGSCHKVLLFAGDTISKHLDPSDQKTQLVLGDAASATLIERGDDAWSFSLMTDGSGYRNLIIDKNENGQDGFLRMDGSAIMEFALREVPSVIHNVMRQKMWTEQEVDQVILHQANVFMLNYLAKKLNITKDKIPIAVENYGNTGPASIPLVLSHYAQQFSHQPMKRVVCSGFGVGLSWGAVALSLEKTQLCDVVEI